MTYVHVMIYGVAVLAAVGIALYHNMSNRERKHESVPGSSIPNRSGKCDICGMHTSSGQKLDCGHFVHTQCIHSYMGARCPVCSERAKHR